MIKFDQAYWYTHECPLRKLTKPVFDEQESALSIRAILHDTLIKYFDKGITDIKSEIIDRLDIKAIKTGVSKQVLARRIEQAIINFEIWKVKIQNTTTIDRQITGTTNNMDFYIDIARYKPYESRIQLIWFRYDSTMPSIPDLSKLVEKAQWNARGFELSINERPMQLTYFFPLLGVDYSILYNPENGYDTVASLIKDQVYYTRPSRICDICNECPMTWAGYLGEINEK
tara:strand:- start:4021 stop:4707 length:687 start_codon:yes stop_codon:yes gene_type:complete